MLRDLFRKSRVARRLYWSARRMLWAVRRGRAVHRYLQLHERPMLHLGAGANILAGWLNVDFSPFNGEVVFDDVTRLSLPSGTFTHIFSEHVIEHLTRDQGLRMLQDSYRVLGENGRIRITTPDLDFFAGLERDLIEEETVAEYLAGWARDNQCVPGEVSKAQVVNNIFYNYGHRFIFDFESLAQLIETAGFSKIRRFTCGETEIHEFENIECQAKRYTRHETFAVEAVKNPS